jgi:hypothetical protein
VKDLLRSYEDNIQRRRKYFERKKEEEEVKKDADGYRVWADEVSFCV